MNKLSRVESDDRLCQRIAVIVPDAAHRWLDAGIIAFVFTITPVFIFTEMNT